MGLPEGLPVNQAPGMEILRIFPHLNCPPFLSSSGINSDR
jgi:hypothetical protein